MVGTRTKALVKRAHAVDLYRQGHTFDQIAERVGWANRGTAYKVIRAAFQEQIINDVTLHRQVEKERLDVVMASAWDLMEQGDVAAMRVVLKCIDQRARLLGLYDDPHAGIRKIRVNPLFVDPGEEVFIGRTGGAYVLDHSNEGFQN